MTTEEDLPRSDLEASEIGQSAKRHRNFKIKRRSNLLSVNHSYGNSVFETKNVSVRDLPTLADIEVGSLVMGTVALITNSGLKIHIFSGMIGFVKNTDIVDSVDVLTANRVAKAPFNLGSNVVCSVVEVKSTYLILSMKPSVINSRLKIGNLIPGLLLPSTVMAHEDHGIVLSFNTIDQSNIQGFIKYNEDDTDDIKTDVKDELIKKYPLSSTAYVTVTSVNIERNMVKCQWPWKDKNPLAISTPISIDEIKPGLLLYGEVTRVHTRSIASHTCNIGYIIYCLGSLDVNLQYIHSMVCYTNHFGDTVDEKVHDVSLHDKVTARIIYVDNERKNIQLTLLSHLIKWKGPNGYRYKGIYQPLTMVRVIKNIQRVGLVLNMGRGKKCDFDSKKFGFCAVENISHGSKKSKGELATKFSVGTIHESRILNFDYFHRWMTVTLNESIFGEKYLSPLQLNAGDIVKGTITKLLNTGVIVQISSCVYGKVPIGHLTQVPLSKIPDRFHIGKSLKLRVLRFDHMRNKLILTAKKILRIDPNPLTQFNQLYIGKEVLGYIIRRNNDNTDRVIVKFYNELQTVLNENEVEKAKKHSIDLTNSSVVKSAVTKINHERKIFSVTLDVSEINRLIAVSKAKKVARKKARRRACKIAFKNYKSSRKIKNSIKSE